MKITLLGDALLCQDQLIAYTGNNGYDFNMAFEKLKPITESSDFVVVNLETPIAGKDMEFTNEKYCFNSPIEFAEALRQVGVDMVTTANNHCLDRGVIGLKKTIDNLDRCGLLHIGTHSKEEESFVIKEIDGIKVGFLAFTYGTNAFSNNNYLEKNQYYMVDLLQEQELSNVFIRKMYTSANIFFRAFRKVARLMGKGQFSIPVYERREKSTRTLKHYMNTIEKCKKAGAEYIISCLHIGGQYNSEPLEYTKEICELSLKLGVNAVIANHEHVIHGISKNCNPNQFCIYSLGNLLASNGVTISPFDKNAEYSVGVCIDLQRNKENARAIEAKYSFCLFHSFLNKDNKVVCGSLFDTIQECSKENDRMRLLDINNELVNIVMGTKNLKYSLKSEYTL